MLAQAAFLLSLIAKELRNGKPFDRFPITALVGGNHPRQGWGHLGPECDSAFTLIHEIVELPDNLCAALSRVEFQRFQRWPVELMEGITPRHGTPAIENVIADVGTPNILLGQRLWIEVTKAR